MPRAWVHLGYTLATPWLHLAIILVTRFLLLYVVFIVCVIYCIFTIILSLHSCAVLLQCQFLRVSAIGSTDDVDARSVDVGLDGLTWLDGKRRDDYTTGAVDLHVSGLP